MNIDDNTNKFDLDLRKIAKDLDDRKRAQLAPAHDASNFMLGRVQRVFRDAGDPPGSWKPLARMTKFIRMKRHNAPNKDPKPLRDKGRLAGSFLSFVEKNGGEFGVGTNVKYARKLHAGGTTEGNTVRIGAFKRRHPTAGTVNVRPFEMTLRGGKTIPPRPFWPRSVAEMDSLGWLKPIQDRMIDHFGEPFE